MPRPERRSLCLWIRHHTTRSSPSSGASRTTCSAISSSGVSIGTSSFRCACCDTEQIPLLEEGGIEAFLRCEVLPYAPDAWLDEGKTQIGYEVSFTRHFYQEAAQCSGHTALWRLAGGRCTPPHAAIARQRDDAVSQRPPVVRCTSRGPSGARRRPRGCNRTGSRRPVSNRSASGARRTLCE
jgi:hypothetical protein